MIDFTVTFHYICIGLVRQPSLQLIRLYAKLIR
ncbi:hypothetical protein J2Z65_000516 [Paenibacillus aceris]|uniref:Uncharacterized protein n=1 Tax=Paenibacillus aceris TaxID=869555 RepID=A0ABS4HRS9_9BACL|nr:hypothetical protein [Paenibacillus aceris]